MKDTTNNRFIGARGSAHRQNFPNRIPIADPSLQPTEAPEGAVVVRASLSAYAANMIMFAQQEAIRKGETPLAPHLTILPSIRVAGKFDIYSNPVCKFQATILSIWSGFSGLRVLLIWKHTV